MASDFPWVITIFLYSSTVLSSTSTSVESLVIPHSVSDITTLKHLSISSSTDKSIEHLSNSFVDLISDISLSSHSHYMDDSSFRKSTRN